MTQSTSITRAAHAATLTLCLIYAAGATMIWPSLMPDPAYGLLVHKSMRAGAPWNHMVEPDPANLARDTSYFYAVWSPGQYAAPGWLIDTGLSTGHAVAMVSVAASLAGLAGWFWLFRLLGYDRVSTAIAGLIIAASRAFNYSFVSYVGSDVLAFAAFPLLAAGVMRLQDSRWLAPFAAVAILIGFFAKNSLPIYLGGWILAHAIRELRRRGLTSGAIRSALFPVAAAIAAIVVIQLAYSSRGWNPLAYEPVVSRSPASYVLPSAMPMLAATGWDDVFSRLFSHPAGAAIRFDYKQSLIFMGGIAAASLFAATIALRRQVMPHVLLLFVFSVVVTTAFTMIFITGSAASLELSRHYRLIGYVWLPLIIHTAQISRRAIGVLVLLLLAAPCAYGGASFVANWRRHFAQRSSHSEHLQVTQLQMTPRFVELLRMLDRELPGESSVVVTPAPMYALEFARARVLPTSVVSNSAERIRAERRAGTVDNLVVIAEVPAMSAERQQAWLDTFTSYGHWRSLDLDNHRLYVPSGQPVTPEWIQERVARLAGTW